MLMDEVASRFASAEDESQPTPPLAAGTDFATADEVSFRDDADELACVVDHGEAADVSLQHDVRRLKNIGVRGDRNDRPGHDLVGAHGDTPQALRLLGSSLARTGLLDLTQVNPAKSVARVARLDAAQRLRARSLYHYQ